MRDRKIQSKLPETTRNICLLTFLLAALLPGVLSSQTSTTPVTATTTTPVTATTTTPVTATTTTPVTATTTTPVTATTTTPVTATTTTGVQALNLEQTLTLNSFGNSTFSPNIPPATLAGVQSGANEIRETINYSPQANLLTINLFTVQTGAPLPTPSQTNLSGTTFSVILIHVDKVYTSTANNSSTSGSGGTTGTTTPGTTTPGTTTGSTPCSPTAGLTTGTTGTTTPGTTTPGTTTPGTTTPGTTTPGTTTPGTTTPGGTTSTATACPMSTGVQNSIMFVGTVVQNSPVSPYGNLTGTPVAVAVGYTNVTPPQATNVVVLFAGTLVTYSASAGGTLTLTSAPVTPPGTNGTAPQIVVNVPSTTESNFVTLDASGTTGVNMPLKYSWTTIAGTATIFGPNNAKATAQLFGLGTYQFQVTVTDSQGNMVMSAPITVRYD